MGKMPSESQNTKIKKVGSRVTTGSFKATDRLEVARSARFWRTRNHSRRV